MKRKHLLVLAAMLLASTAFSYPKRVFVEEFTSDT